MKNITQERLRELLHYDPSTGAFVWLVTNSMRATAGSAAGSRHCGGYSEIGVDGHSYLAHRLAWLYVYGEWPRLDIDHINGNRGDNRIENLRDVSRRTNNENRKKYRPSKTGILGATPVGAKFMAKIASRGRQIYLGLYDTAELAHAAYVAAKRQLHKGCTL